MTTPQLAVLPGIRTLGSFSFQSDDLMALAETLRQSLEDSLRVEWSAADAIDPGVADLFTHLPPPSSGGGPAADRWRSQHSYGLLYSRNGPGFISVRERRPGRDAAMFTLEGTAAIGCWETLRTASAHRCGVCDELVREGVAFEMRGLRLALPFRLLYPPTPFLAI